MNTQVSSLLAVLFIHGVSSSYGSQAHNYAGNEGHYEHYNYGGNYGHGHNGHDDLRYHGPIAIPHVLHDGHIADTHEVAAAKAQHYKAVASAKAHSGYGHGGSYNYGGNYGHGHSGHDNLRYHGPIAIPHVLYDGHIADTHEVAIAKAEHYKAVASAKAHSGYGHEGSYGYGKEHGYDTKYAEEYHTVPYHGPLAKPVLLKSGYLADTHEVSAAKAAHHNAVVTAKAHSGYGYEGSYGYGGDYKHGGDYCYGGSYKYTNGTYGHGYSAKYHNTPYHGPLAKPVVLKSGYLADTHEVAAAKEHHVSALHSASTYYGHGNKW